MKLSTTLITYLVALGLAASVAACRRGRTTWRGIRDGEAR